MNNRDIIECATCHEEYDCRGQTAACPHKAKSGDAPAKPKSKTAQKAPAEGETQTTFLDDSAPGVDLATVPAEFLDGEPIQL